MKRIFFFLAIIVATLFSCNKSDSVAPTPATLDGKWRMIIVKENASGLTTTKPSSTQGDVEIIFTSTTLTNGTFIGNTPTNDIWQNDYSVTDNQAMTIACLSMTKVMETPWGNEFVNNIRNTQEYGFEVGGRLNIKTTNKTLTFQKL